VENDMKTLITAALFAGLVAPALQAAEVTAEVKDRHGNRLGAVLVRDTPSGVALATLTLNDLPEGLHAVHLHETGDCSASDFKSAGGHVAGDREHGVLVEGGPHPGDMPNLTVKSNGVGEIEQFLPFLNVSDHLLDEDGAAFIMHDGVDDYESQPAGDAGDRIACGEFTERTE
jgi:superoxide dismutase, Cu-Zn family